MQLFVGLGAHRGGIKRYPFDILELPVSMSLPKPKTLKEMKSERPDLAFSLRLHPDVVFVGVEHPDVDRALIARDILGALAIVIPTGPRFTPTEGNRRLLVSLVTRLATESCPVAWEPRGVFSPRQSERWADEMGALLVRDLTREAGHHEGVIYTRLLGLGAATRVSLDATELLAEQLEGARKAIVIATGEGVKATRTRLRDLLEVEDASCPDT